MPDELREQIESVASGPASVSGDEGSVAQQDLSKLIEADRYLRQLAAQRSRKLPIRTARINPGGAV